MVGEFITVLTIILAMYFCDMKNGEKNIKNFNDGIVKGKYFF